MTVQIRGQRQVLRNLNRQISMIKGRTVKGLLAAGLFVENESNKTVPQDKGVLLGSSFTKPGSVGGNPIVNVGYTAKYAPFVHEMPASNNFSKTGTGPKFLLNAVTQNISKILNIIASRAMIR